jgi:tetratricopeptide (TPR) repeat protein
MSDFNKAISLKSDYAFAYVNRAAVRYKQRDFKGAVEDCNKAISLNSNYAEAYLNRGIAKEMLRDGSACDDFSKAANLGIAAAKQYVNDCK